jgi:hypothetical protein
MEAEERYSGKSGQFESVDNEGGKGPAKSVEGWIVFVQGINEEASEEGASNRANPSHVMHMPQSQKFLHESNHSRCDDGPIKQNLDLIFSFACALLRPVRQALGFWRNQELATSFGSTHRFREGIRACRVRAPQRGTGMRRRLILLQGELP